MAFLITGIANGNTATNKQLVVHDNILTADRIIAQIYIK